MAGQPILATNSRIDIIAIGASAGGLAAITEVLAPLSADFPCALVVVQHLHPDYQSRMAEILSRRTKLNVKQAQDGDQLSPGTVYIAPPDNHLLVLADGVLALRHTQKIHFLRPSADVLFESVASSFMSRSIGVVLSGTGSDASAGLTAIKNAGGITIAEDYKTAEFPGMPESAWHTGLVDFILPLSKIGAKLIELVEKE